MPDVPGVRIDVLGRPPSWNHVYESRGGRRFLTDAARRWKDDIRFLAINAVNRTGWRPTGPWVVVRSWIYLDTDMDADNAFSKLTLDALARGLRVDDRMFLPRVMEVHRDQPNPRMVIYLSNQVDE